MNVIAHLLTAENSPLLIEADVGSFVIVRSDPHPVRIEIMSKKDFELYQAGKDYESEERDASDDHDVDVEDEESTHVLVHFDEALGDKQIAIAVVEEEPGDEDEGDPDDDEDDEDDEDEDDDEESEEAEKKPPTH